MTRQHFEMIARVVSDSTLHLPAEKQIALAVRFADELASTNERFDRARFLKACGLSPQAVDMVSR